MGKRKRPFRYRMLTYADASSFGGPTLGGHQLSYTQVLVKPNTDASPFCVPNEYIASTIGRFLGLPIPPCGMLYDADGKPMFASLDFNFRRLELAPIQPEVCFARFPRLSTGVVLFDILIANEDRHDENLAVDSQGFPTQLVVFDQDQALFGGSNVRGIERLESLQNRLGVTGSSVTGGNRHCLLDVLNSNAEFAEWYYRIEKIPSWFLNDVCQSVVSRGITKQEADAAVQFLDYRRIHLEDIVQQYKSEFTSIAEWTKPGSMF